jgi:hypothetical protein
MAERGRPQDGTLDSLRLALLGAVAPSERDRTREWAIGDIALLHHV